MITAAPVGSDGASRTDLPGSLLFRPKKRDRRLSLPFHCRQCRGSNWSGPTPQPDQQIACRFNSH